MASRTRRKCRHCGQRLRPDPRSVRHQRDCSAEMCRRANTAASQRRWPAKAASRDYFRVPELVARVRWRFARRFPRTRSRQSARVSRATWCESRCADGQGPGGDRDRRGAGRGQDDEGRARRRARAGAPGRAVPADARRRRCARQVLARAPARLGAVAASARRRRASDGAERRRGPRRHGRHTALNDARARCLVVGNRHRARDFGAPVREADRTRALAWWTAYWRDRADRQDMAAMREGDRETQDMCDVEVK